MSEKFVSKFRLGWKPNLPVLGLQRLLCKIRFGRKPNLKEFILSISV